MNYILEGKVPVKCDNLAKFSAWFDSANRHVAQDQIGDVRVSTVFLGIDHNHSGEGAPILFETMIFGGEHDEYQERYSTWEEAEAGHKRALKIIGRQ